jgi:hypothetical protein
MPPQDVHRDIDSTTYQSSYQQTWPNVSVFAVTVWFYKTHTHTIFIDQCAATWGYVPTGWLNCYTCPATWIMLVVFGPFYKIQYEALYDSACRQRLLKYTLMCKIFRHWGFPCFFLSCNVNARVRPAKMGHGPQSSKFLCSSMYCLFCVVLCIVCVWTCTVLLPSGGYPTAVNKHIYHIISYHWFNKLTTQMFPI